MLTYAHHKYDSFKIQEILHIQPSLLQSICMLKPLPVSPLCKVWKQRCYPIALETLKHVTRHHLCILRLCSLNLKCYILNYCELHLLLWAVRHNSVIIIKIIFDTFELYPWETAMAERVSGYSDHTILLFVHTTLYLYSSFSCCYTFFYIISLFLLCMLLHFLFLALNGMIHFIFWKYSRK